MDVLAKNVAAALRDSRFRKTIHDEISKEFDGTTDALLSHFTADPSFAQRVGNKNLSPAEVTELAADLPRLQLSVPVNFDRWNPGTYAPLVASIPVGVDDLALKTMTAYDSRGVGRPLDAQTAPSVPVIVVSLNERTDEEGNLRGQWSQAGNPTSQASHRNDASVAATPSAKAGAAAAAAPSRYSVDTRLIELHDDNEPWALGDAEISIFVKTKNCNGTTDLTANWPNLNNSGDAWAPGTVHNFGTTTCNVLIAAWEDDGGAWNFELTIFGFGTGIGMDNDDDMIGKKELAYSTFKGGGTASWLEVKFGTDLDIWME